MRCNRVKERDIEFDSHISGFVYKVRVNDEVLIKKEIPGPDTVDEFLYEINALNRLRHAKHVIRFYGVIIDDNEEHVKGLLISYAEQGALVDIIYDQVRPLPWSTRERWARQIVAGLSEIHEAGFVQGDFTLSNIVIDGHDNAKIIDINRRGCPVGWEPPEATPLIESNQRISMYIGVKSDLYQLGMVLWSLAMKEDEPEAHGRPLRIGPDALDVPVWFRTVVDICLSDDPRGRMSALQLLSVFPDPEFESVAEGFYDHPSISVDDGVTRREYFVDTNPSTNRYPRVRTVQPASDWSSVGWGHSYVTSPNGVGDEPFFYPTRGRSPPSPLPSNPGEYDPPKCGYTTHRCGSTTTGSAGTTPSETDTDTEEKGDEEKRVTPQRIQQSVADARHQEPEPTASLPGEADDKAIPKMAGMEANQPGVDEGVEAALTEEPRTPPQAAVIPVISGASLEHDGYLQKCDAGPTELWIESAVVQDTRDKVKTTETGLTEPVEPQNASKPSPTPDGGPPTSELAMLMNETDAGGRGDDVQALTGIEGKPDLATALPTGLNPAIAMDGTQTDTEEKLDKGDQVTTENVVADQSNPASESTALMSGSCDLPDELKGVGSTYETGPENWHQSMTNHDIAELIDAEMAADTTHDASNDTTATRHTDE
jgi:serine/threonine protein kinase